MKQSYSRHWTSGNGVSDPWITTDRWGDSCDCSYLWPRGSFQVMTLGEGTRAVFLSWEMELQVQRDKMRRLPRPGCWKGKICREAAQDCPEALPQGLSWILISACGQGTCPKTKERTAREMRSSNVWSMQEQRIAPCPNTQREKLTSEWGLCMVGLTCKNQLI